MFWLNFVTNRFLDIIITIIADIIFIQWDLACTTMSMKIISVIFGPKIRIKPAIFCINFRMLILQSFILKLSMYKAGESEAAVQCSFVAL